MNRPMGEMLVVFKTRRDRDEYILWNGHRPETGPKTREEMKDFICHYLPRVVSGEVAEVFLTRAELYGHSYGSPISESWWNRTHLVTGDLGEGVIKHSDLGDFMRFIIDGQSEKANQLLTGENE